MGFGNLIMILCCAAVAVVMFACYGRTRRPFRNALLGMGSGAVSLGALKVLSIWLGFTCSINLFTCFLALILGLPGVVFMGVMGFLFGI